MTLPAAGSLVNTPSGTAIGTVTGPGSDANTLIVNVTASTPPSAGDSVTVVATSGAAATVVGPGTTSGTIIVTAAPGTTPAVGSVVTNAGGTVIGTITGPGTDPNSYVVTLSGTTIPSPGDALSITPASGGGGSTGGPSYSSVQIGGGTLIMEAVAVVAATTPTVISSYPLSDFQSVDFTIQATKSGPPSLFAQTHLLGIHDQNNSLNTEYGTLDPNNILGDLELDVNNTNHMWELSVTNQDATQVVYRVTAMLQKPTPGGSGSGGTGVFSTLSVGGTDYTETTNTVTGTTPATVASFSSTIYRSAEFTVQATNSSDFMTTKINCMQNGTDTYITEYGTLDTNNMINNFDAQLDTSGNVNLVVTLNSPDTTTFRISMVLQKI